MRWDDAMIFKPALLLLAAIVLLVFVLFWRAHNKHKLQEMDLTADELKTFNERYRFKRNRADMPTRFLPISATSDRLRWISTMGSLGLIAGIAYVIFRGPNL
jgi:hypothetical protein